MVTIARVLRVLGVAALPCAATGCLTSPKAEALRQAHMQEAADAINDIRVNTSALEATLAAEPLEAKIRAAAKSGRFAATQGEDRAAAAPAYTQATVASVFTALWMPPDIAGFRLL